MCGSVSSVIAFMKRRHGNPELINVLIASGITAASGIAAELGLPLTHRGISTSLRFLTGHSRKGGTDPLFVAENAADPDTTLVVYMGLSTLPSLAKKLMDHGLSPHTPAAAIERGTTPQQRTVRIINTIVLFITNI